ncbi:CHAT domain-containing protein [Nonomuraea jiangxiensis]|uniref:CHAT domain-containing protein n=1 Tax=Nonomuraea jiangxiensis TaxID=633440 RepID=A0A1G8W377_9ACTN|nr:CHAT domain-containing protein [Nonomuraea jiangxiensis]SDJ72758.1 CHAT domain-containing protein [Nonomuraea jiangxiensis]
MQDTGRVAPLRERVERLHKLSVEATDNGRPALAARRLRQGLTLLGWSAPTPGSVTPGSVTPGSVTSGSGVSGSGLSGQDGLLARLLTSLAHAEAEQGRTGLGMDLLEQAQRCAPPAELAIVHAQRGLLHLRTGSNALALRELDLAAPMLVDHDRVELARVLLNRSVIHLMTGRVRLARDDARQSAQIAHAHGHEVLAAKALHNDGYCDLLLGDVPAALAGFARVEPLYRDVSPGFLPVLALDRARALLAVGLTDEAGRTLDRAIDGFRKQRLMQDYAEAELARAQCALDAGRVAEARTWARRAELHFWRRDSTAWALRAVLMRLRGEFARTARPGSVARRAADLSGRFEGLGMPGEAEMARLVAIRALVAAGRLPEAVAAAAASPAARGAPLDVRLMRHLTAAELAGAHGKRGLDLRRVRAGLALIHSHRGTLGSLDMLTGVTALGADLAARGLTTALSGGSARHVFTWSERCRAQAFRYRPPHAPEDERTAEALAELRQLAQRMHADEAAGQRRPELRKRCLELEQVIRERGWQLSGAGPGLALASTREVEGELAADDCVMVSLFAVDGRLLALTLGNGRCRLHELSAYEPVAEAARRLAGDLNAQAGRILRPAMRAVIEASARRQLGIIADAVVTPLRAELAGARGIVIVPTRGLSAVPWGLLPGLRGRPLMVAPSALAWSSARRARSSYEPDAGSAVLVAGPDLEHAEAEIEQLGAVHPKAKQLRGGLATVSATLDALDGASFAHFATHGHHERENVFFSRLDLADGPLMAYDLQRLGRAPGHVVLSACDVGQAVVRAGDELLGFTAALLYLGTSTVISSLTRVPDETAGRIMMTYHRNVAAGARPADALAAASADEPAAAFVCFGAG